MAYNYNKNIFKKSEFFKLLKRYFIVFCLPLITLGVINYKMSTNFIKSQWEDTHARDIEKVCANFENQIDALYNFSLTFINIPDIKKLVHSSEKSIYSPRRNQILVKDVIEQLNVYSSSNGFTDNILLYLNNHNIIISQNTIYYIDDFSTTPVIKLKGIENESFLRLLNNKNNMVLVPIQEVEYIGNSSRTAVFIQSIPVGQEDFKSTLIYLVPEKNFENIIKKTLEPFDGSVYITDQNGAFIAGLNNDEKIKEFVYHNKLLSTSSLTTNSLKSKISIEGTDYLVFKRHSPKNKWNFFYIVSSNKIYEEFTRMLIMNMVICLAALVIGIIIAYTTTRITYKPLNDILSIFINKSGDNNKKNIIDNRFVNEYEYLKTNVKNVLQNEDELKRNYEIYKPFLKNYLLYSFLKDETKSLGDFRNDFERFDVIFPYKYFMCIYILKKYNISLTGEFEQDIALAFQNESTKIYLCNDESTVDIIVVNMSDLCHANLIVKKVAEWLVERTISFKSIGVGKIYESINELHKSYKEAEEIIDYRIMHGENSIIYYKDITETKEEYYFYPYEIEEEIVSSIKAGEPGKAICCYRELLKENITVRNCPPYVFKYLLYDISSLIFKVAEQFNIKWDNYTNVIKNFIKMDNVDEMCLLIDSNIKNICNEICERKESGNKKLISEIVKYIDESYYCIELSLTSVAEYFNLSSSYLSRFFKEQTGYNFLEYLNKKRIEESAKLINLYSMRTSINDIAEKVGFTNDTTFRRQFKKYIGVTPVEYRSIANIEQ